MRLPAVAIAAAFAGGIVLGLHPVVARNASSHTLLSSFFMATAIVTLTGILLARVGSLFLQLSLPCSAGCCLDSWAFALRNSLRTRIT